MEWEECDYNFIIQNLNSFMEIQYQLPQIDLWLDYNTETSTFVSFIACIRLNSKWRYRIK